MLQTNTYALWKPRLTHQNLIPYANTVQLSRLVCTHVAVRYSVMADPVYFFQTGQNKYPFRFPSSQTAGRGRSPLYPLYRRSALPCAWKRVVHLLPNTCIPKYFQVAFPFSPGTRYQLYGCQSWTRGVGKSDTFPSLSATMFRFGAVQALSGCHNAMSSQARGGTLEGALQLSQACMEAQAYDTSLKFQSV